MPTTYDILRPLTPQEYADLKTSLKSSGQMYPIIHDQNGVIIDGHHRTRALLELGLTPKIEVVTYPDEETRWKAVFDADTRRQSTSADRKAAAARLYSEHNMTMDAIAKALGVNQRQISRDLEGLDTMSKPPRPKGGRPKAPPKPPASKFPRAMEDAAGVELADGTATYKEVEEKTGMSNIVLRKAKAREEGRREGRADPIIDPATLSVTAQAKFDAAVRQYEKTFADRVRDGISEGVQKHMDETLLPILKKEQEEAAAIVASHKGVMTGAEFKALLRCLHADTWQHESQMTRDAGLQLLQKRKAVLVTIPRIAGGVPLPATLDELIRHRMAKEAAKRKSA